MEDFSGSCFSIDKLNNQHKRKLFTCGIGSLDDFFQKQATQDARRNISITYVLSDVVENRIVGFYTLSSSVIELQNLSDEIIRKLPGYPLIPAILIGRLAIDKNYQGKNFGEMLLMNALSRSYESSKIVASFAVIVEAINKQAISFYKKYGFIDLKDKKLLYMTMKTIKEIFG